jgi:hypothetical protein
VYTLSGTPVAIESRSVVPGLHVAGCADGDLRQARVVAADG